MEKPSKLERWLTIIANLTVVGGILLVAVELQQNTRAIQAQTRDSITEKQMDYYGWLSESPDLAGILISGVDVRLAELSPETRGRYRFLILGLLREFENSHYQYVRGLFTPDEFEARISSWRANMDLRASRDVWALSRNQFAPDFRAEIDAIVAEIEN